MDPINYIQNVKSPFESAIQGYQIGLQMKQQQAAAAQAEAAKAAQLQMQQDLAMLAQNKNAKASDYSAMMTKYPQLSEQMKRSWDVLNSEQQAGKLSKATEVYSALQTGNIDIAKGLLDEQAKALRNAGNETEAKHSEAMAKFIELNPEAAKTTAALGLSAVMGPDKFASTFESLSKTQREEALAPSKLQQAKAEAQMAQIKAKYAEPEAVIDLQQKGWNIKKLESDIITARENNRIAAMNAATAREGNAIKRQELQLKVQEEKMKIQEKLNTKVAEVESARGNIDNMLNVVDKVLQTPLNVKQAALGPVDSRLPTVQTDVADYEALIETMKSGAFLAQIPQLKTQISDGDRKALTDSFGTMQTTQSVKAFESNLKEVQRILLKNRKNIATKYGVPDTAPDTPAASAKAIGKSTDDILKELGVM